MDNTEPKYTFEEWIAYLTKGYHSNMEVTSKQDYYDSKEINVYVKHPKTRQLVHVYEETI